MSLAACAEIVRNRDADHFLAAMAAPPQHRAALFVIYAFDVELVRATGVSSEPMINEIRLQWWADALGDIIDGTPVPPHEVLTPLAKTIDRDTIAVLQTVVTARRGDSAPDQFADGAQLQKHLRATCGALMWAAARAVGARGHDAAIRDIGSVSGLASLFRSVPDLVARGYAPLENIDDEKIGALARDGLHQLARARQSLPAVAHPATRASWLADRTLRTVAANPATVAGGRLHMSEFSRKASLLWRVVSGRP